MGDDTPEVGSGTAPGMGALPHCPRRAGRRTVVRMRDDALSIIVTGSSSALGMHGYLTWLRQEVDLPLRVLLTHSAERFLRREVAGWYRELLPSEGRMRRPISFHLEDFTTN